jgi:hypothetical protein
MRVTVPDKIIDSIKYRSRKLYVYRDNKVIHTQDIINSIEEISFNPEDVDSIRFELIDRNRKPLNIFLNIEKFAQPFQQYLVKGNLENLKECLTELDNKYLQTQKLSNLHFGDKNLIYYTVYGKDYLELFYNSVKDILKNKPNNLDILLITDNETLGYLNPELKINVFILETNQKYLARLYVTNYPEIKNYGKVLYLDSDTKVTPEVFSLFDEEIFPSKWYTVSDSNLGGEYKVSVYYSLKPLSSERKTKLLSNSGEAFNSGQFLFVCNEQNLAHIENMQWLSSNWQGEYFQDQSIINYYINYYSLGEHTLLNKYVNVENTVQSFQQKPKAVTHFARSIGAPEAKKSVLLNKPSTVNFVLVSHNHKINGATHSLYILANFLKSKAKQILILEVEPNPETRDKYGLTEEDFKYYYNDPVVLYALINQTSYHKLLFNSVNKVYKDVWDHFNQNNILRFSREVRKDYKLSALKTPDFVITEEIAKSYLSNGEVTPQVQSPILPKFLLDKMDKAPAHNFNTDKIVIGMSGMICNRKNYNLFKQVAGQLNQYYFVWIGGEGENQDNLEHIAATSNPYSYYKGLDYFVLFSEYEPFGNVVIENLYLGNKVLTFRDNIFYRHTVDRMYFEYPGRISLENAKEHILNNCVKKRTCKFGEGTEYVKKNFSKYNKEFLNKIDVC